MEKILCGLEIKMSKKISSYQKIKNKNKELIDKCNEYYRANYYARKAVGSNEICGFLDMCGNEESMPINDPKILKKIILNLPV